MVFVYDLKYQPQSVGDILTNQQVCVCFGETVNTFARNLKKWDWFLPALKVNQYFGEIKDGKRDWPIHERYSTYDCWEFLTKHYEKQGLEPLKPRLEMELWAKDFLQEHGNVTVNLRRNLENPGRNSDYPEWLRFFKNHPEDKFVVTCRTHEIPDWGLPNVTIADVGVEKICALVEASDIHLGVASGPVQMRWYQQKPFAVWREAVAVDRVYGMSLKDGCKKMPWMNDKQRMFPEAEKHECITREFDFLKRG